MDTHAGRVALVTGAARGIGQAIACELARRGADVIAVDVDPAEETVAAVEQTGRRALSLQADISDPGQVDALTPDLLAFGARVDILVNNAAVFPARNVFELDFAEWRRIQSINIDSQLLMAKAVIGTMREQHWGRIVNLASNTLALAVPNMVAYLASKGAVVGLTRGLANDLAPYGITVNAVCPTASRTPGMSHVGEERLQAIANTQAIKRIAAAEDVAGTVCFLSSDDSAFMTGQTLVADGGLMRV